MRTRIPVPIPNVLAAPRDWVMERPMKPPRKRAITAMILWSREMTQRRWKSLGSAMSSHHTVVNTTVHSGISFSSRATRDNELNEPVVANCVLTLLPMIPCNPILALANPRQIKAGTLVQAGSSRESATLGSCDLNMATAAAMVKSAWINVPKMSHARVLAPILSPMRPRKAPPIKVRIDVSACLSAMWKLWSVWPGWKSRAKARASCTVLPVWKPTQTKMAEKETASLVFC